MIYLPSTNVPAAARTWAELQKPKVSPSCQVAVAVDLTVPRVQTVVTMDRAQEPAPNCEVGGRCRPHDRSRFVENRLHMSTIFCSVLWCCAGVMSWYWPILDEASDSIARMTSY